MTRIVDPPINVLRAPKLTLEEDQWFVDGYAVYQGQVYKFHVDRKDQKQVLSSPCTPADFLASDLPELHKTWLRRHLETVSDASLDE